MSTDGTDREPARGPTPISQDFIEASEHDFKCRCDKCLDWWVAMGPDGGEPDQFGPFTTDEVRDRAKATGETFSNGHVEPLTDYYDGADDQPF